MFASVTARAVVVLTWTALICGCGGNSSSTPSPDVGYDVVVLDTETETSTNTATCSADIDCLEGGMLCIDEVCTIADCRPKTIACRGNTRVQCTDDGQNQVLLEVCTPGTQCRGGKCTVRVCEPDSVVCQGSTRQVCNSDGTGYQARPCQGDQICFNGMCNDPVCEGDAQTCLNDLTAGVCEGGVYRSQFCGFASRCEGTVCTDYYALEFGARTELTASIPRPTEGSVGLWLVLDDTVEGIFDLLAWQDPKLNGLRLSYAPEAGTLWVEGHQGEPAREGFQLNLKDNDVSYLQVAWLPGALRVFLDGRPLEERAVEGWSPGTAMDTLRIGRFHDGGTAWPGRLGAVWFDNKATELALFVPHCDLGHTDMGSGWLMQEGEGAQAASTGDAPPLQMVEAVWTGGILGGYARDADADAFGFAPETITACRPSLEDEILSLGDCNDGNQTVYPGAPELEDTIDNDCDDITDEQ